MGLLETRVLTDHVYDAIRSMIEDGVLTPGEKINKKHLEEQLGVSQTPINDALIRLEGQRILEQKNRRGFFVKEFSCRELVDLFAARAAVEGMATRLAVENVTESEIAELAQFFSDATFPLSEEAYHAYERTDRDFHTRLIEYSRNELIQEMNERFGYIVRAATKGLVRPPEETIHEHRAIIAAIHDRDAKRAGELMTDHLMRSRAKLLQSCDE